MPMAHSWAYSIRIINSDKIVFMCKNKVGWVKANMNSKQYFSSSVYVFRCVTPV